MKKISVTPTISGAYADSSQLVAFNLGEANELFILESLSKPDRKIASPGFATFFKTQPDNLQFYELTVYCTSGTKLKAVRLEGEKFNITDIQPIQDGYLLVSPRCHRKSTTDIEKNGRLYNSSGALIGEVTFGDGIQQILVSENQKIWVSYFDEGIFGNYGWDDPLGASGLVAWSLDGKKLYEFEPKNGLDYMADCYAMNLDAEGNIWCCYYTDFPIVKINTDKRLEHWVSPVKGASYLAVDFPYVLFIGGYEDPNLFQIVQLNPNGTSKMLRQFHLDNSLGDALTLEHVAVRGKNVSIAAAGNIYVASVSELLWQ